MCTKLRPCLCFSGHAFERPRIQLPHHRGRATALALREIAVMQCSVGALLYECPVAFQMQELASPLPSKFCFMLRSVWFSSISFHVTRCEVDAAQLPHRASARGQGEEGECSAQHRSEGSSYRISMHPSTGECEARRIFVLDPWWKSGSVVRNLPQK